MKLTRKDIANYKLLKVLLERDQRKLDRYIANTEIHQRKEWDLKCREMEVKIQDDIRRLNELEMAIDTVIANANDVEDKMILEYTKDGMSQQQIAMKVGLDRSVVSKRIKKYVSA